MFDFASPWVVGGWLLGLPLLYAVTTLLFYAGCALAEVDNPSLGRSLLAVGLALLACVPAGGGLVWLLGSYDTDPNVLFGPMRILGIALALLVTWVLSGVLYKFLLTAPYRKGLFISAVELLLGALLSALVTAVVLVVLAAVQIARGKDRAALPPAPAAPLTTDTRLS
jgi:hypothetical protein